MALVISYISLSSCYQHLDLSVNTNNLGLVNLTDERFVTVLKPFNRLFV